MKNRNFRESKIYDYSNQMINGEEVQIPYIVKSVNPKSKEEENSSAYGTSSRIDKFATYKLKWYTNKTDD